MDVRNWSFSTCILVASSFLAALSFFNSGLQNVLILFILEANLVSLASSSCLREAFSSWYSLSWVCTSRSMASRGGRMSSGWWCVELELLDARCSPWDSAPSDPVSGEPWNPWLDPRLLERLRKVQIKEWYQILDSRLLEWLRKVHNYQRMILNPWFKTTGMADENTNQRMISNPWFKTTGMAEKSTNQRMI